MSRPVKKSDDGMEQISIRLPSEWIKELGKSGKRTIGPEIRRRLAPSFDNDRVWERYDAALGAVPELADGIFYLGNLVGNCFGDFTEDRFSFDAMKATVDLFLDQQVRPEGESVPKPSPEAIQLFGEGEFGKSIENISRVFLAMWREKRRIEKQSGEV